MRAISERDRSISSSAIGAEAKAISAWAGIEILILAAAWVITFLLGVMTLVGAAIAEAHPGGLAADGCHFDRKAGVRHCHGSRTPPPPPTTSRSGDVYYPNCAAARAAGAAPIYRGQPGYGRHLDRDGDGKACE